MEHLRRFASELVKSLGNLLPIVAVVLLFQVFVFRTVPDNPLALVGGLAIVAVGIALFLHGLDLSIFPVGKNLSNQFVRRGSLGLLLPFAFAIGFAASIAEPAVIAVAEQAQLVSDGRISGLVLRFVIAISVGLVLVVGVLRVLRGWAVYKLLITGYVLALTLTFFSPPEVVGLAYDSGGVTTNIVSVPLIAAIGIGLANSIRGRSVLSDGFGLVALCVMVPVIGVQLYGIWVYNFGGGGVAGEPTVTGIPEDPSAWVVGMIFGLAGIIRDVLPIVVVVLFFQFVALRRRLAHPLRVVVGFTMVLVGLYAFVVGLKLGLFPLGTLMAQQLITQGTPALILLFAFLIGFAVTMAEPALLAIGEQAQDAAPGRISAFAVRVIVALGVAVGIGCGTYRILFGGPFHYFIMAAYVMAIVLVFLAPKYIIALAFDLGGVTTSEVTVPLVTALGIGLATAVEGRNELIDGFGLIAYASIFPVISVMVYAMVMEHFPRLRKEAP